MNTITVTSFASFIRQLETLPSATGLTLFRGQPIQGELLPAIARPDPTQDTAVKEKAMLRELQRIGASLLPRGKIDAWELFVTARHFGMATRLLDWTANPLAALWFACAPFQGGDAYVYVLAAEPLLFNTAKGPFDQVKTRVYKPRLTNPRIIAQDGWFTVHRYSKKAKRFVRMERNPEINKSLTEIRIGASLRASMVVALDRYGVSERTLFPDLVGLCGYLNWKMGGP